MKSIIVFAWAIGCALPSWAETKQGPQPKGISTSALRAIGRIPIQSGGRIKPFDSFARETVIFTTGSRSYGNFEPVEMILSWMISSDAWLEEPFLRLSRKDVQKQLLLDESRSRFSPAELLKNPALAQYARGLDGKAAPQAAPMGGLPQQSQREQELRKLVSRIQSFRMIVSGDGITLVPQQDRKIPWLSLGSQLNLTDQTSSGSHGQIVTSKAIADGFSQLIEAYKSADSSALQTAAERLTFEVERLIPDYSEKERKLLGWESLYNRSRPFFWAMVVYLAAAIAWTVATVKRKKGAVLIAAWTSTALALGFHVYGFALRMMIAGRPPVSNMYESVIWVSFGIYVFALILYASQKQAVLPAVASFLSSFALLAADAAPAIMDPMIHPLVPVLRSNYWLTIHVLTITLGYAAFALALGLADVSLAYFWKLARDKSAAALSQKIMGMNQLAYRATQFGVVLIAAGTILGGVWADASWGRFWGWDPKEVWALIVLLCYIALLHARFTGWVGQFGFAAWSVLNFLSVVMAWYGVNFVLGVGLHSYGFASGGGFWVATFCVLQGAYVGAVAWRYKRSSRR